jgi:protein TonB
MAVKNEQPAPQNPRPQETTPIQPAKVPLKTKTADQKIAASQPGAVDGSLTGNSETSDYRAGVRAELARNKYYPRAAKLRRKEGVVHIEFILTSDGGVQNLKILKSSGSKALDEATLKMVRKSVPFAPFPSTIRAASLEFKFPVRYNFE